MIMTKIMIVSMIISRAKSSVRFFKFLNGLFDPSDFEVDSLIEELQLHRLSAMFKSFGHKEPGIVQVQYSYL